MSSAALFLKMDTQYHPNNMSGNNPGYSTLPGLSPHQMQQNSTHPPHTLPPLQPSPHASMQSMYGGNAPQTPRTLATPNTPASATTMNFSPQLGQASSRYQMMPNNNQQTRGYHMISNGNEQGYRVVTTMVPQSSGTPSMGYPQAIAPAPQNRISHVLRPLSQSNMHMQTGMSSPYGQQHNSNKLAQMGDMEPPTHVVGSQGRRGILPSAPGRPPVTSSTGKNTMIPTKDADGKFPCPHCTKSYLHAKHLKRHLLRHTGDRPYMCILCRDTFSRSDILKRHFQKCSIRRGNPTGASHLSHSQAHLKKSQPSPRKNINENEMMEINGLGNSSAGMQMYGVVPDGTVPDTGSSLTDQQVDQLQPSDLKRMSSVTTEANNGRNITGMSSSVSNRSVHNPTYPGTTPGTMPSSTNPSLAFTMSHGQNGHSYNQGYEYTSSGTSANVPPADHHPDVNREGDSMLYSRNTCVFPESQNQV